MGVWISINVLFVIIFVEVCCLIFSLDRYTEPRYFAERRLDSLISQKSEEWKRFVARQRYVVTSEVTLTSLSVYNFRKWWIKRKPNTTNIWNSCTNTFKNKTITHSLLLQEYFTTCFPKDDIGRLDRFRSVDDGFAGNRLWYIRIIRGIGYFRIFLGLLLKTRLGAQSFLWKWV